MTEGELQAPAGVLGAGFAASATASGAVSAREHSRARWAMQPEYTR
jgi:hypothetical protein